MRGGPGAIRPFDPFAGIFTRQAPGDAALSRHAPFPCRLLPLVVLAAVGFAVSRDVGWDSLARHQALLQGWVATHPFAAAALYLLAYTAAAAVSLPDASILTITGGLLFGRFLGCALTIIGATTGASILLLIVRSAFSDASATAAEFPRPCAMALAVDGFSYLLALRLVPLFPFWLVNLSAAVVGLRLAVFVPRYPAGYRTHQLHPEFGRRRRRYDPGRGQDAGPLDPVFLPRPHPAAAGCIGTPLVAASRAPPPKRPCLTLIWPSSERAPPGCR